MKLFAEKFKIIDLTYSLDENVPTWNGSCGFHQELKLDYEGGCRVYSYKCHAGIGTHMDAPSHFIPGGKDIGDISLEQLIVPVSLIDVRDKAHADFFLSAQDILDFEKKHGVIPPKSLVIGYTGWGKYWNDVDKYRSPDAQGKMHYPGFSAEAAELLLQRQIAGIGIDTLSPDGSHKSFPVHHLILGAGKYILENLANLDQMPSSGAYAIVLPMKVRAGTEAPVRAIALLRV